MFISYHLLHNYLKSWKYYWSEEYTIFPNYALSKCRPGMPYLKDEVISHFTSNSDIIDCIIASALIPFALNGRVRIVSVSVHAITAELVNCWKMRSLCSSALLHHCPLISPSSAYLECIYCMICASVHSNSYFFTKPSMWLLGVKSLEQAW